MYFKVMTIIHAKSTSNITLNNKKLKTCLIKSEKRQGLPLLPLQFSIVSERQARAISQQEVLNDIQVGKGDAKLSLFSDDMISCVETLKTPPRNPVEPVSKFSKV